MFFRTVAFLYFSRKKHTYPIKYHSCPIKKKGTIENDCACYFAYHFAVLPEYRILMQKLNVRIKHRSAEKLAPLWGGKSQTAQGEQSVTLGIKRRTTLTKTGIDGYGVPVRNDIFVNAMMFPDISLPPRCRPFLPKRRQRGGRHYANSYGLSPGLRFAHPGLFDSRRPVKGLVF